MARLTRDALLAASDLREKEIDLPSIGGSVLIRSLPAEYSNAAISQAIKVVQGPKGEQTTIMDNGTLELLQVQHGLVDPHLESLAAVRTFAQKCGPAFKTLVKAIVDLSDLSEEAAEMTAATFPAGGGGEAGRADSEPEDAVAAANGGGRPDLHARAGA